MNSITPDNRRPRLAFNFPICVLALLLLNTVAFSQGGSGKEKSTVTSTPTAKPTPPRIVTPSVEGTAWGFEAREGPKLLGKGVIEFLPGGAFRMNGEQTETARWRQNGRALVITNNDSGFRATMEASINGNQINGTITARDDDGTQHRGRWNAKRADAALMAELNYWNSIRGSMDAQPFKDYLSKYPYGYFVEDAIALMKTAESMKSAGPPATNLEGTIWGVEMRQGSKVRQKGVLEFLPNGKLLANGDTTDEATWKQTGNQLVITVSNGKQEGTIAGNEMSGKYSGIVDGVTESGEWTAKRADDELVAEYNFWKPIRDSANAADYKKYLDKYPYGYFVQDALAAIKDLEAKKKPEL